MLQGSLENFALDEVLGLLSSTNKTGQLEIAGDRGTGSLMFSDGSLVDGTASYTANGSEVEDVMFELLRYGDGTFTFTNREIEPGDSPQNVATVLSEAEKRLIDWRQIEAVVPTLDHHVAPSSDLPADEVTITRAEWSALTVIAAGCPASLVCDQLNLGEVEGSRQIKNLAERRLVEVSEPLAGFNAVARTTVATPGLPQAETPTLGEPSFGGPGLGEPAIGVTTEPFGTEDTGFTADIETEGQENDLMHSLSDDSLSDGILSIGAMSDGIGQNGLSTEPEAGADRPPMPPIPTPDELVDGSPLGNPPTPPSPSEISDFSDGLEDLSGLVEEAEEGKGGLLARYRKGDE